MPIQSISVVACFRFQKTVYQLSKVPINIILRQTSYECGKLRVQSMFSEVQFEKINNESPKNCTQYSAANNWTGLGDRFNLRIATCARNRLVILQIAFVNTSMEFLCHY